MPVRRGRYIATVTDNISLCREHFRLVLEVNEFPPTRAGQFIQIACREVDDVVGERELEWPPSLTDSDLLAPRAVLCRPFSLAGRRDRGGRAQLEVIHRVVGVGTRWLADLRHGDRVAVLGPLGNTFAPPAAGQTALLVGGGVGIPPMLYLASELAHQADAVAMCGATTRDLLPLKVTDPTQRSEDRIQPTMCIDDFAVHGIPSVITTDDGSLGCRGFVTQALERYLDQTATRGNDAVIYTCGPEVMMKRVAEIAIARQIPCQVAVERAMACGMGTCQSCCIRVRKKNPAEVPLPGNDWCYRLACTDGPIFAARDLLW